MSRVQELEAEILRHRQLYYNQSAPEVSDAEYDKLEAELKSLAPDSPVLQETGAPTEENSGWSKSSHDFFVGSLDKAMDLDELRKWGSAYKGKSFFMSEKLDGLSIVLYYENGTPVRAVTRGNGEEGEDILANVCQMKNFPGNIAGFNGSLRGEILLHHSDFLAHFEGKVNARNAASGAAKKHDGENAKHLSLYFYSVREDGKDQEAPFKQFAWLLSRQVWTAPHYEFNTIEHLCQDFDKVCEARSKLDYDIDGIVIWVNEPNAEEVYGLASDKKPRAAVALKFPAEEKIGTIADIRWDLGLGGRLTPVAVLEEPLFLAGANITNVNLHNLDQLLQNQVTLGAKIGVVRSGDVIPYMTRVASPGQKFWKQDAYPVTDKSRFQSFYQHVNLEALKYPETCPKCGEGTEMSEAYVVCPSTECSGYKRGKVLKWITVQDLKHIGEGLVTELVEAGKVNDPADLYTLTVEDVESIDRRSSKHFDKVQKALESKKEISFPYFMAGLGIPKAGRRVWKNIEATGVNTWEQVEALTPQDIEKAERMGPEFATTIHQELHRSGGALELGRKLQQVGVTIKQVATGGKLTGKSFCFTGKVDVEIDGKPAKRKVLENLVEENGGTLGSVSKNLSYLVIADPNSTSSKAVKARKLGTQLISPQEFLSMIA